MAKRESRLGGPFLPVPRWALNYIASDYTAQATLNHMLLYLDPDTQALTTSYQHIADMMGCDRRTVMRSVARLEEIGVVTKEARTRNNRNITNRYYVSFNNPGVFDMPLVVSPESPLVVSLETLGSVMGDTTSSVTGDTQSRVTNKNKENKKRKNSNVKVDRRLLNEEAD